jgi:hypothetical protein
MTTTIAIAIAIVLYFAVVAFLLLWNHAAHRQPTPQQPRDDRGRYRRRGRQDVEQRLERLKRNGARI